MTITDHCIERYIERVCPNIGFLQAKGELEHAIVRPLFSIKLQYQTIHGCVNRRGWRFLVMEIKPGVIDTCGPEWFWHVSRKAWKEVKNEAR